MHVEVTIKQYMSCVVQKHNSSLPLLHMFSNFKPLVSASASMTCCNITITKFFLDPEFAKDGELKPAKYKDVIAEAFKKSRLVIFMILRTPDG